MNMYTNFSYFICNGSKKMENCHCVIHDIFYSFTSQTIWEAMPNRQVNAWIKLCLFIVYEILFNFFKKNSKNYTKFFRLLKSITHTRLPGILWRTLLVLGQFCMYFQGPRNDFYLGGPNKKKNDIFRIFEIFTL